jgi:hypothetical protein
MLYESEEAAEHNLVYPYCISANSLVLQDAEKRDFADRWVRVEGMVLEEDRHEPEPNTIRTLSSADGMMFGNWCYGPYVLRIESIAPIKRPEES